MAVAMLMAVLVGGEEEAREQEQERKKARRGLGKRRVGRPYKPLQRPRGREQSCLVRGQQAIQAAVIRGEEVPMGHVVTEVWLVQAFPVSKPTKSWAKKCKEKEAKKRSHKNKQERACHVEQTAIQNTESAPEKKHHHAKPPKQAKKRERAKQEKEGKRSKSVRNVERNKKAENSVGPCCVLNECGSRNRSASVVSEPEKNGNKSVSAVSVGMRRFNMSENSVWHADKNGGPALDYRSRLNHRLDPQYSLLLRPLYPFLIRLREKPTREKGCD